MPSLDTCLAFFALVFVLGFAPGPDNIFVMMQSVTQGRKAGLVAMLGMCAGLAVHTLAVALGLAAIFAASATAFTVLKVVGAVYLAYLAWQAFRAPVGTLSAPVEQQPDLRRIFLRGWVMNLTNPKIVFFFLALLPQFVHADRGSIATQLCVLGAIFILSTLMTFGAIAYFSATVSTRLRSSPKAQLWLNRMAGTVFLGMAARLAMAER
ncbi:MAG: LysE family translocator [Rhodoferax sp.]|uniref:LysE family translocator n=1 Tax=Rhodoferax sp. TaxID=50421 RepID=UPI003264D3F0